MYILTEKRSGGVYAGFDNFDGHKLVQVFEEEDDAQRYLIHLEAQDYPDKLEVMEVDPEVVAINCNKFGYQYTIVSPDDFIIPPL
tara:strand:+ start:64 stop:318 length:255 start_codon:yes stop_codon:yes gene_type:complete